MVIHPDARRDPRRVRLRIDEPGVETGTLHATLIPTFGDVIVITVVAGTSHRRQTLARLACMRPRDGFPCVLIPEPANPYDPNAIGIWTRAGHSGFVTRAENEALLGPLAALEAEHGTPIAVAGELWAAQWGVAMTIELPEPLRSG